MQGMIEELILKFGSDPDWPPLTFKPGPVTIFVGPNNSGKSLLLREIETLSSIDETVGLERAPSLDDFKILEWMQPQIPEEEAARKLLLSRQYQDDDELDQYYGPVPWGYTRVGKPNLMHDSTRGGAAVQATLVDLNEVLSTLQQVKNTATHLKQEAQARATVFGSFVWLFTIRLDGSARLALTRSLPSGPLGGQGRNLLQSLFQNGKARERLRSITRDAFGRYFVIDPTDMQSLSIRMSVDEPPAGVEESLSPEARAFFEQAADIADLSDGIKAFTGLAAAVLSSDYRIMLIDEPEAFLHPVLARKLGRHLTEISSDRQGRVLAATHSPEFLMGCVESGEVNVVRLTFQDERATARHLPSDKLRQMMAEPLLRSTGILDGLFHEGVVVSESDTDRAIYQEVSQRLSGKGQTGAGNTLFVNAHEKSSVRRIVQPLREMGIPAAAIVDLDIIKNRDFNDLLASAFVPPELISSCNDLRSKIDAKFTELDLDMKRDGIGVLPPEQQEAAEILISNVAEYGVFVVPTGELERWFPQLHNKADRPGKSRWVPWVFGLMNDEPGLFEVEDGDVWGFMRKVGEWISDSERKGIPA